MKVELGTDRFVLQQTSRGRLRPLNPILSGLLNRNPDHKKFLDVGVGIHLGSSGTYDDIPEVPTTRELGNDFPRLQITALDRAIPDYAVWVGSYLGIFNDTGRLVTVIEKIPSSQGVFLQYHPQVEQIDEKIRNQLIATYNAHHDKVSMANPRYKIGLNTVILYKPFDMEPGNGNIVYVESNVLDHRLREQIKDSYNGGRGMNIFMYFEEKSQAMKILNNLNNVFEEGGFFIEGNQFGSGDERIIFAVYRKHHGEWVPESLWFHPDLLSHFWLSETDEATFKDRKRLIPTLLRDSPLFSLLRAVRLEQLRTQKQRTAIEGQALLLENLRQSGYLLIETNPENPFIGIQLDPYTRQFLIEMEKFL